MTDKELMDFSFDIRRQPDYTASEVICLIAQKLWEWVVIGFAFITFAFVFWTIFEAIFGSDNGCGCDHNLDDYY